MTIQYRVTSMRVAIFDFDGTLYEKETYQLLMNHLKTHPLYRKRYPKFIRTIFPPYIAHKAKLYPEGKMRSQSMQIYLQALEQLTIEEADIFFEQIAQKMKADFNPKIIEKVQEHAENGDHIMLVSGAFTPLLHVATEGLPFHTIIGTDIPIANGKILASAPISHIQGTIKNDKIQQYLAGQTIDWKNSAAYADSYSDLSVLSLVGHPIAVDPDKKLQNIATRRGWTILS